MNTLLNVVLFIIYLIEFIGNSWENRYLTEVIDFVFYITNYWMHEKKTQANVEVSLNLLILKKRCSQNKTSRLISIDRILVQVKLSLFVHAAAMALVYTVQRISVTKVVGLYFSEICYVTMHVDVRLGCNAVWRFWGTYCFHLQSPEIPSIFRALKMEAVCSSETLVFSYKPTRRHSTEDQRQHFQDR
jgi:hypothetical protein